MAIILVIEVDGKATPTATEAERDNVVASVERHRPPAAVRDTERASQARLSRQEETSQAWDKSKNGRSITLVVMYTLKRGDDGRLHGPIHKRVWGS